MYFGIDLGTTNSLIGSGKNLYSGLVSSSVDTESATHVSRDTVGDSVISSYKVNMNAGESGKLPIACSAVVLRDLAKIAEDNSGVPCKDIVVSVPAKFNNSQRTAVAEAAKKAGLNLITLINEPTAAAIYVAHDYKDLLVVYDLGGGTFDISIIDARAGNYATVATDGRLVAGDNFDAALCARAYKDCKIQMRYMTKANKKRLMMEMRLAKEALQRSHASQFIDMSYFGVNTTFELTPEIYVEIMKEVFGITLTLTRNVINENLSDFEKPKLVFVGGSTACPFLKEWISSELGLEYLSSSEAPDYIVAKGVALYASMVEDGTAEEFVSDVTGRLVIESDTGKGITVISANSIIPIEEEIVVYNSVESDKLILDLYQGNAIMCTDNDYIGTLVYDYGRVVPAGDGYITVTVKVNIDGIITLSGTDMLTGDTQDIKLELR